MMICWGSVDLHLDRAHFIEGKSTKYLIIDWISLELNVMTQSESNFVIVFPSEQPKDLSI